MRLSLALLLPAIAGVAQVAGDSIHGFVHGPGITAPPNSDGVVLTPRQFRLVLAGQLDLSQYHALTDESDKIDSSTVDVINRLVSPGQQSLFDHRAANQPELSRYLVVMRGTDRYIDKEERPFTKVAQDAVRGGYPFSVPASSMRPSELNRLMHDIKVQAAASGDVTILDIDFSKPAKDRAEHRAEDMVTLAKAFETDSITITFLVHTDSLSESAPVNVFGIYSMPGLPSAKRQQETPMSESFSASSAAASTPERDTVAKPLPRLPALCYNSLEACTNATNGCSGHGECFRKYGPEKGGRGAECFACGCLATYKDNKTTYWGGAACQKQDVSSQFWILAGFSVLLMGLVGWAIGMMFSIGNEKLPGVIGAGVAPKTR